MTAELTPASARLPERQREALELHEQEGLSYEEIAARLDASWISVAKLIAHARINLYDELHGTILASMAPSAECERALPLIAAREDDELDPASADGAWLDGHLEDCGRCQRGVEEMGEIGAAYGSQGSDGPRPSRRQAVLAAGLAALLLFAGVATAMRAGGGSSTAPADSAAASAHSKPEGGARTSGGRPSKASMAKKKDANRKKAAERSAGEALTGETTPAPVAPIPVEAETGGGGPGEPASRPARSPDNGAVQPPRTPAPKPVSKPPPANPAPSPALAPTPTPSTAPLAEEPAPVEEPPDEPPRGREPPGKPAHAPSKK